MIEAALAGPLSHTTRKIDFLSADFPALIIQVDDHSNWTGADDSPSTFDDVRNSDRFAIDERSHRPNSNRISDSINVPAQRRFPMIDVFGRPKHFEVQARPTLAPDIDRVALIEIDS